MKTLLLILFIFQDCFLFCQKIENNFIGYFNEINQAEIAALDSNYSQAAKLYNICFVKYKYNYPKDCLIAAQVAALNNDDSLTSGFLERAILFGATKERIEILPVLSNFTKSSKWSLIISKYDSLRQRYQSSTDTAVRRVVNNLYIRDQAIRDKNEKLFSNLLVKFRPRLYRKWQENCVRSFQTLDSIILIHGFPSFKLIGVDPPNLPKLNIYNANSNLALVIIYHYDKCFSEYGYKLIEEVKKGSLHPYHYALVRDMEARAYEVNKSGSKSCKDYYYYVRWEVNPLTMPQEIQDLEAVEKRREEIGLLPFYYERKKKTAQNRFTYYSLQKSDVPGKSQTINWFYYDM